MTTTTLASLTDATPLPLPVSRLCLLCVGAMCLLITIMKMVAAMTRSLHATNLTSVLLPSSPVLLCRLFPVCAKVRVCMKL